MGSGSLCQGRNLPEMTSIMGLYIIVRPPASHTQTAPAWISCPLYCILYLTFWSCLSELFTCIWQTAHNQGCHVSWKSQEKWNIFKVRELSGNFEMCQGKICFDKMSGKSQEILRKSQLISQLTQRPCSCHRFESFSVLCFIFIKYLSNSSDGVASTKLGTDHVCVKAVIVFTKDGGCIWNLHFLI